jgi:hypothetical protein
LGPQHCKKKREKGKEKKQNGREILQLIDPKWAQCPEYANKHLQSKNKQTNNLSLKWTGGLDKTFLQR